MDTKDHDSEKDEQKSRSSSPTSALSYASNTRAAQPETRVSGEAENPDTHTLQYPYPSKPSNPNSDLGNADATAPERESHPQLYQWSPEGQFDDQLLRIPISPTSTSSDPGTGEPVLEVFVDNLYYEEIERSPSPITYARPGGVDSDSECDDLEYGRRRRRLAQSLKRSHSRAGRGRSRGGLGVGTTVGVGSRRHKHAGSGGTGPSSPISYHSDDSSLFYYGTRPRRRRREQSRSYRYSYRSPVSPTSAADPSKNVGRSKATVVSPRSPSPILYAPRRSLDFLYDSDSDDDAQAGVRGDGRRFVGAWWGARDSAALGFLLTDAGGSRGRGGGTGKKVRRRTAQPRSFRYEYSTPPDVQPFEGREDEREHGEGKEKGKEEGKDKERGRKRERALIPMPLVNYKAFEKEKEREKEKEKDKDKEKPRTRKGSRGILDELAAVAVLNAMGGRKASNTAASGGSRSRSPKHKNKEKEKEAKDKDKEKEKEREGQKEEKEKKRKWVWDLNSTKDKSDRAGESSTSGSTVSSSAAGIGEVGVVNQEVLDIGVGYDSWSAEWEGSGRERKKRHRHSLAGLEFR